MAALTLDLRNNKRKEKQKEIGRKEEKEKDRKVELKGPLSRGKILLSWEAPEYVVYKKSTTWYIIFGIVLAFLLFIAFLLKSFLTIIVFLLSGILIYVYSERSPKRISYDIRTTGVRIGERIFLYRELEAFNIIERGGRVYLLLKSRRLIMPLIHVPLGETDPEVAQEALLDYLEQDETLVEPLVDVLAHWLGF